MLFLYRHPDLLAFLTGFVSGLLLSIPVGPINLTILNEGAKYGLRWALLIGTGASIMEVIYCAIAFTGFASFFTGGYVKAAMELFSFMFMFYLGLKFLLVKATVESTKLLPSQEKLEARISGKIEEKLHPHSGFMIGFTRVLGNPGVLLFWIILAASFISREWVEPTIKSKLFCISGVLVGTFLWYFSLGWISSKGHNRLSEVHLVHMERISGVALLLIAVAHGGHIVYRMTNTF